jgi:hypothetical protein
MFEYLEGPWWEPPGATTAGRPWTPRRRWGRREKPAWVDAAEWRFMRPLAT